MQDHKYVMVWKVFCVYVHDFGLEACPRGENMEQSGFTWDKYSNNTSICQKYKQIYY